MSLSLSLLRPAELIPPESDSKIILTALTNFGQSRLDFYGSVWIVQSFEVYAPSYYHLNDPYYKFCGKLTLVISPLLDLPQQRRLGFPTDPDFTWNYQQDSVREL